jgi:hypothetical protein
MDKTDILDTVVVQHKLRRLQSNEGVDIQELFAAS